MKRMISIIIVFCAMAGGYAQLITEGTRWFDGKILYTTHILDNGEIYFNAEENTDGVYAFSLRKLDFAEGEYMLVPSNMIDDSPLRAQYGWRVQYVRKEGMNFLAVRNRQDRIVWTLVLTPDNLSNCLAQQKDAEEQPIENLLDSYLMNTKLLANYSKEELKQMHDKLKNTSEHSIIAETNMDLIANELEVVEYERLALINEDRDLSFGAQSESKDYFALVTHFTTLNEALEYAQMMGYPIPVVHGLWEEYEKTFVVLPAESSSVVELWRTALDEDFHVVRSGETPVVKGAPGRPLIFSYMVPEGIPGFIIICRKENGEESKWVPVFNGSDGSLMTDSNFINGKPVG